MAEPLRLRGSAMADPHGRAPLLGGSGVGQASSVRSFERIPLVFGAFLEAPKSYDRDFRTVAKLSSIRTQRFLFRRIQRSFDPPNTSKRRRVSRKRAVGDPAGGPLPFLGLGHGMAEPLCLRGSAMADPHGRAPLLGGSGVGQASSVCSFYFNDFAFTEIYPLSVHVATPISNCCEALFDTDATVLVS